MNLFKKSYSRSETEKFDFLRQVKLFEELTNDQMAHFLPHLYLREYKSDEVIFFRDDPSHALYVLANGEVTLNIDIKDRFEELALLERGAAFGDNAVLEHTKRIYTAVASSEVASMFVIPQINILQIFEMKPLIKAKMLSSFSEIYNQYTKNLFEAYRTAYGFFDLKMVYRQSDFELKEEED